MIPTDNEDDERYSATDQFTSIVIDKSLTKLLLILKALINVQHNNKYFSHLYTQGVTIVQTDRKKLDNEWQTVIHCGSSI